MMMNKLKLALLTIAVGVPVSMATIVHADVLEAPTTSGATKQIDAGNVLTEYNEDNLTPVYNTTPKGNRTGKYDKQKIYMADDIDANTYDSIAGSTQKVSLKTNYYLPDGFNVSSFQHGNFQSVAMDDEDNIYFVESNGTDTNKGAIVKFNRQRLKELGVENDIIALWESFYYFNPYTDEGRQHNTEYNQLYNQGPFAKINKLTNTINKNKEWQNNQVNYQKNAKKWYQHWKEKKAKNVKITKSYSTSAKKKAAAQKVVKQATEKMARWMKSYKMHKAKVANYNKKLANYQKQLDGYQATADQIKKDNATIFKYADIVQTAQLSPEITIGHGQTLAFNPANQHLYLAEDTSAADLDVADNNKVLELDTNTLKPVREYQFKMLHAGGNLQLHTLAFDNDGNAYWGRKRGKGYMFFHGRLDENGVKFAASKRYLVNRGGKPNQFVTVNRKTDCLYFVSDDIFTSLPTEMVRKGSFAIEDINYQAFSSKREFEGLAFDQDGYGYALLLWPAELMKTSVPLK